MLKDLKQTGPPNNMDKKESKKELKKILEELDELQNLLYASNKYSVLIILQGLDASGKDSLTRRVFGQMNPQGVRVTSFKAPSSRELEHDFLWRIHKEVPEKGMIRIFNRSQYEDILVPTVHETISEEEAFMRMEAINNFEQHLIRNGNTKILKFFLNVSVEEQNQRFAERLEDPRKMWKYNENDKVEMKKRNQYLECYEKIFKSTGKVAAWHVIPADKKWYRDFVVATLFRDLLKGLDMKYPSLVD